jgi:hypothetical protein
MLVELVEGNSVVEIGTRCERIPAKRFPRNRTDFSQVGRRILVKLAGWVPVAAKAVDPS